MERKLILRGVLAGAIAGLLAYVFARIFAEPVISQAIGSESGRDAVAAALAGAAGLPAPDAGPDIFSRAIQANVGIGAGMIAFGAAMGALMALLPELGQLAVNQRLYGNHATETPRPLRSSHGDIVHPGFPADVLFSFLLYSLAAQAILWGAIGPIFAPLAGRLLAAGPARAGLREKPAGTAARDA